MPTRWACFFFTLFLEKNRRVIYGQQFNANSGHRGRSTSTKKYTVWICISKSNCNTPVRFWPFLSPRAVDRCGSHVYMRIYWYIRSPIYACAAKYNSHTPSPLCAARENDQREREAEFPEYIVLSTRSPRWLLWWCTKTISGEKKCLLSLQSAVSRVVFKHGLNEPDLCVHSRLRKAQRANMSRKICVGNFEKLFCAPPPFVHTQFIGHFQQTWHYRRNRRNIGGKKNHKNC